MLTDEVGGCTGCFKHTRQIPFTELVDYSVGQLDISGRYNVQAMRSQPGDVLSSSFSSIILYKPVLLHNNIANPSVNWHLHWNCSLALSSARLIPVNVLLPRINGLLRENSWFCEFLLVAFDGIIFSNTFFLPHNGSRHLVRCRVSYRRKNYRANSWWGRGVDRKWFRWVGISLSSSNLFRNNSDLFP